MLTKIDIIYDGQCRFCQACVVFFRRVDWLNRFQIVDGSDWEKVQEQYPALSSFESLNGLCVIDGDQIFWGFFSFRRMMCKAPILWPFLLFPYAPGMRILGPKLYGWIAKNRYRIGCEGNACEK